VTAKAVKAYRKGGEVIEIAGEGLKFARPMMGDKVPAKGRLRRGALIRVQKAAEEAWQIVQLPQVEAGLVSIDATDGAVRALVGGFDFNRNKFNHASQAYRQPGLTNRSSLGCPGEGSTPATVINDAPIPIDAETGLP
jgi:penicillin-binding protein 1A